MQLESVLLASLSHNSLKCRHRTQLLFYGYVRVMHPSPVKVYRVRMIAAEKSSPAIVVEPFNNRPKQQTAPSYSIGCLPALAGHSLKIRF